MIDIKVSPFTGYFLLSERPDFATLLSHSINHTLQTVVGSQPDLLKLK